jgi:hypothetical protein
MFKEYNHTFVVGKQKGPIWVKRASHKANTVAELWVKLHLVSEERAGRVGHGAAFGAERSFLPSFSV